MTDGQKCWERALSALRRTTIAMEKFKAASSAASAPPDGRSFEAQEALDDEFAGFVDAADAAMLRLLGTPVPDLEALAVKIALVGEHRVWELDGGEECLAWLEADARRLAAGRRR
jgi:hypothetical protein